MKKVLLTIALLAAGLTACNTEQMKYGQGGKNACQFVKEQVPELRDDIESVEVICVDTFLCDRSLSLDAVVFANASLDFGQGRMSKDKYQSVVDDFSRRHRDIVRSWTYGRATNDSLRNIKKYDNNWRRKWQTSLIFLPGEIP